MTEDDQREQAKQMLKNSLVGIKTFVIVLNKFAVDHLLLKYAVYKNRKQTVILDLCCECDEIIGLLEEGKTQC